MSRTLVLFVLLTQLLFALEFHSYDAALAMQKENGKIIMLDVVRTNCHYCADMDENVFNNEAMSRYLSERFIPVKINLDRDKLPMDIKVHFTPTFFFINKEQKIIKTIPGSWSIEDFKELTKNIK